LTAALVGNLAWFYYTNVDWQTYVSQPPHLLQQLEAVDQRIRGHLASARGKAVIG
jgi:hypothetical protein